MIKEKRAFTVSGYGMLVVLLLLQLFTAGMLVRSLMATQFFAVPLWAVAFVIVTFCWHGLFMVAPNQGKILQLFGKYVGTEHTTGLRWTNPLIFKRTPISLRVRNFESGKLKVNDANGNPIEIATVVVWKVVDSAEAYFEVDDYESFVTIQSEAALRNVANEHPYDNHSEEAISLRGDPVSIAEKIRDQVQERLGRAGIQVIEARISHLAYAPEIAQAMLRKQQAGAVLAARKLIVQGAVEMVTDAIATLAESHALELDEERKANMVNNLMVVICGEQQAQPVINSGSLY
ncbi:SPFH domain-containing protein [Microbulbifer hydrolyticus]|uniref:Regulator of protease activity HflC (Stomatin/prohibitin superfamily) n=1 Tax=Microbulbifer hydrolyticus TaxID=48074 RepID=A0AA89T4U3_9GAMM|nr:SPFH domain-containing protein [Microbulbifer hydrolyticus]MBB5211929.1 regulator of protease activity HflC (stomatin/prohibitin superfamily) [Microbulbifer hydrolyticus]